MPAWARKNTAFCLAAQLPLAVGLFIIGSDVSAHSAERGLVLLLPSEWSITGGALTVAASFLLLAFASTRGIERIAHRSLTLARSIPIPLIATSFASFIFLVFLLIAGFAGTDDPLSNPLSLCLWTLWWGMFTVAQCLFGDLWRWINPWSGPLFLIRRFPPIRNAPIKLPDKIGYLPAIVLFSAFIWLELVSLAPEDPKNLAWIVMIYWFFNAMAMLLFGEREWANRGEPFSVFFRLIGATAPLQSIAGDGGKLRIDLVFPGSALVSMPALPLSGILFVLLTLSSVTFDGFSRTFTWLEWIGVNPLEFPGRSAVALSNGVGIVASFTLLTSVYFFCAYLGCRIAGKHCIFLQFSGRLVYSIIPISLAFHCAHYFPVMLVNSQYILLALNDPFGYTWNLLNANGFHVTTSFFNRIETVAMIWGFQTAVVVAGHIVGIGIAHAIALHVYTEVNVAVRSQLFLASFMVVYTVLGLWLLSTATIG